ncbi:uncharacterized protein N7506_007680 [Penicillium brevicompactum]|uniref:uncharacterized protein n=1 Tax=Penicillium brevicompactum TaxID=5074 RepID=UPI00254234BE|nr:uncharacterized protein N7506_007680 [Penicillium brevicompactum]KAJ5333897.1 hypothetical protein N7506_007680 [Penicillium brevicompactum]
MAELKKPDTADMADSRDDAKSIEATQVHEVGQDQLNRALSQRHLVMMAIGGVIGPGYFMGMGTGLSTAGPAGLLICFAIVGILLWFVIQSLGEIGSFIAVSGSFTHYSARFIDPAWGFALGWNYFLLWAVRITFPVIFWSVIFMSFALLGVWAFGEAEFWLALVKIIAILSFFLCSILISTGVIGGQNIGFKYYHDPGPFADEIKGVFQIFVFAGLQYSGTEMIGLTAGESRNPSKDIPKAVKSIVYRIVILFQGGVFFLTITVPWNDENLLGRTTKKSASSPFVIAFNRIGATAGGHAINAVILVTIFSAVNSAVYVGSRTLYGLAKEGAAPKVFLYTLKNGSPIVALVAFHILGFLSLLNLSSGAGAVYTWVVSMTGVATFITFFTYIRNVFQQLTFSSGATICLCHIRLRKAMQLQNMSPSVLPYRTGTWPWGAYLGFGISVFFVFFQGWTSFAPWSVQNFFMNYIIVIVFIVLGVSWKIAKKTHWVRLETADLVTGRRDWLL